MRNYQGATWWAIIRAYFNEKCSGCGKTAPMKPSHHWVIHHKDGNHQNNIPDNLQLLCRKCHAEIHFPAQFIKRRNKEVICPRCKKNGTIHNVGRGYISIYHGKAKKKRGDGREQSQDMRCFMRRRDLGRVQSSPLIFS